MIYQKQKFFYGLYLVWCGDSLTQLGHPCTNHLPKLYPQTVQILCILKVKC